MVLPCTLHPYTCPCTQYKYYKRKNNTIQNESFIHVGQQSPYSKQSNSNAKIINVPANGNEWRRSVDPVTEVILEDKYHISYHRTGVIFINQMARNRILIVCTILRIFPTGVILKGTQQCKGTQQFHTGTVTTYLNILNENDLLVLPRHFDEIVK